MKRDFLSPNLYYPTLNYSFRFQKLYILSDDLKIQCSIKQETVPLNRPWRLSYPTTMVDCSKITLWHRHGPHILLVSISDQC